MAEEKRRFQGELAAWHICQVAGMFGSQLNPAELNPYRVWTAKEIKARAAFEKKRFWAALGVGVFGKNVFQGPANAGRGE